ncbi:MAG: tRNA threonylcarbamoyl adenosine modification protein YjeE [Parcubacteria bacterium C7867-001]|nr:MAG: tRNA threonylcarbamoyl adenosine modification protein YjeE [Parcubacteria bacterium C7867-001]
MEKHLANLEMLQEEAAAFAQKLSPKTEGATLVTLIGELGAGKTSFVQGLARALAIEDAVTSPTFVLEKVYATGKGPYARLAHIDAYRLKGGKDLPALGFDELLKDPATLVCLEWPELVADGLPNADHAISLRVEGEGRIISYA